MLVFLSWSKARSKKMTEALNDGLQFVLQNVEPWFSAEDVESGDRWNSTLTVKLSETKYGIVCVTQENVAEPWLLFEAGAIAKTVDDRTRLCPVLLDLTPGQMTGPLTHFQARRTDSRDEMLKLFVDINNWVRKEGENACDERMLTERFEAYWPTLNPKLDAIRKEPVAGPLPEERTVGDKVEEILRIVRQLPRDQVAKLPRFAGIGALPGISAMLAPLSDVSPQYGSLLTRLGEFLSQLEHIEAVAAEGRTTEISVEEALRYQLLDHGFRQLFKDLLRFAESAGVDDARIDEFANSLLRAQIRMKGLKEWSQGHQKPKPVNDP